MNKIARFVLVGVALAAVFSALSPLPALADEEGESKGFMSAMGRVTFNRYCASCHGLKADGSGPVARMLKIPPADLRRLSIENDGEFPADRVNATIDGREDVKGHGNRDMPVWGEVFQTTLVANPADPEESGEDRAVRKTRELVLYIQTLQVAPEADKTDPEE